MCFFLRCDQSLDLHQTTILRRRVELLDGIFHKLTTGPFSPKIPRIIWITMKRVPQITPNNLKQIQAINRNWTMIIVDDANRDKFMDTVFANTSVLWAFKLINSRIGAVKADIWRYCILYVVGGVYLDSDSYFSGSLDKYIMPQDRFIFGTENG